MTFVFGFSNILTIILFLIIICFVIAWHELGHLLVAKKCNVYCYEYSIGFGPEIYRNKKHETHFVLRAIPLGGFVKMAGEEGQEEGENHEPIKDNDGNPLPKDRLMAHVSKGKKAAIMAAGGIMNMILAIVCFYIYIAFSGGFMVPKHTSQVTIAENSILYSEGMETGDIITKMTTKLNDGNEHVNNNIKKIKQVNAMFDVTKPEKIGDIQYISITYKDVSENDTIKEINVTRTMETKEVDGKETTSITLVGLGSYYNVYKYNAFTALWGTWHFMGVNFVETFRALGNIFQGDMSNLSGLVGIYEVVDDAATNDTVNVGTRIIYIIYLLGAISFSLGFFNLIPFPALDGGRIFFVGLEAVTKKKVNPNVEATIHFVGLVLLFGLMIVINLRDVFKLFG